MSTPTHIRRCHASALLILLSALAAVPAQAASWTSAKKHENPNVLWNFVHGKCAPAALKGTYPPSPCIEVDAPRDPGRGYVVFKDRAGAYQYLVLPLARITGIESPRLLVPGAPNYLADAWTARMYVEAALHKRVPRDILSLVVNSPKGRTQNQLHIHVDCIAPAVHDALQRMLPGITREWAALPERLPAHQPGHPERERSYRARWVGGATLPLNPFRALADALPAGDNMAEHSLVVVGARDARGRPGFILLSTRADPATKNDGNSDNLQDTTCALAADAGDAAGQGPSSMPSSRSSSGAGRGKSSVGRSR